MSADATRSRSAAHKVQVFWAAHFVAGMLMSRIFGISKFQSAWREKAKLLLSFGDLALVAVLVLSVISTRYIEKPLARRLRKRGPTVDSSPAPAV